MSTILYGSRVKTSIDNEVTNEIFRLRDTDNTPSITDLKFSRSEAIARIKENLGDSKFRELAQQFGQDTSEVYSKVMGTNKYKNADDEEKKEMLDKAQTKIYNKLKKKYDKKKKTSSKRNLN